MKRYEMFKDIPMYSMWSKIEPINKGWSTDKKYYIEDIEGKRLLLRISDITEFESKKLEYDKVTKVSNLGINMSKPIDFGTCSNGELVYSLLLWVDGEDAENFLPKQSKNRQYQLGVEAGESLRKIHSIPAPKNEPDWYIRYKKKIYKKLDNYKNCPIKMPHDDKLINFIEENIVYLKNRPQVFHHGDYHVGNLIVTPNDEIGIIDFNRWDYGDPWEEFNRCVFSWRVSIPFAVGQIHRYFNNCIPDEFFRLMALYIATNTISAIPWAIQFGEKEIDVMLNNAKQVIDCYDNFNTYIPTWYKDYVQ